MECARDGCPVPVVDGNRFCSVHRPVEERAHRQGAAAARPSYTAPPIPSAASQILCPHCQVRGGVTTGRVKVKRGVSGGKVTGAVLTGGLSMLGTGLSRKQELTEMRCGNCSTVWHVE